MQNDSQQGDQDTQRIYRLGSGPNINVSPTGGQRSQSPEPTEPQDRARQRFRTRERQIREVRPVDFTVRQVEPARQRIQADIRGQAERAQRELAEEAPKLEEFLPDYQKALSGDQQAIRRTGERLQRDYQPEEIEPLRSTSDIALRDYLRAPSQDAFGLELQRQRAGTSGVNALDAARLAASGVGAMAFDEARGRLASAYDIIPELQQSLENERQRLRQGFVDEQSKLRSDIIADELAMRRAAEAEIEAYKNRDVNEQIRQIEQEAKLMNPELARLIGGDMDFSPFIDRDIIFEETLDPQEAARYNVIAELLGKTPVQRIDPGAGLNRDAILQAFLAEAQNELAQEKAIQERILQKERIAEQERRETIESFLRAASKNQRRQYARR